MKQVISILLLFAVHTVYSQEKNMEKKVDELLKKMTLNWFLITLVTLNVKKRSIFKESDQFKIFND